jgi:CheY-like chemotaxis protein
MNQRPLILLLENDENDVFWFRRALTACQFDADIRIVESVVQARDYLAGRGEFGDRFYYRMPDLIVTDFKLQGLTGVEFIRWLKTQHDFKEIPVVMYSGTALPEDRRSALEVGARAFYTKSGEFKQVCEAVDGILKHLPRNSK